VGVDMSEWKVGFSRHITSNPPTSLVAGNVTPLRHGIATEYSSLRAERGPSESS
jgi:hypothetical protein